MQSWSQAYQQKLILPENIEAKASSLRAAGKKLVTLNGTFDILHAGHLQLFFEARQLGDVVIAALNSDSSVKEYKSPLRPFIPLEERLQMIAALEFVDYVTWFDETDPRAILEKIRPAVHANGAYYGPDCIEREVVEKHGGRVHLVDIIPGLSTSQLITKIIHVESQR
jgi:D-glycero-beta-D-manno-heptose 1-phosphate adenylyltransferase